MCRQINVIHKYILKNKPLYNPVPKQITFCINDIPTRKRAYFLRLSLDPLWMPTQLSVRVYSVTFVFNTMAPPKLYMMLISPSCRAVMVCAKILKVELEIIEVEPFLNERTPLDFLNLNPLKTVPTLDDNGFIIWNSHAIMAYLVSKYSRGHYLYPEDIKKRAIIDQKLHFDSGTLFPTHSRLALAIYHNRISTVADETILMTDFCNAIEEFLARTQYVTGDNVTIADISIWTTLSNIIAFLPELITDRHQRLVSWIQAMGMLPDADKNLDGMDQSRFLFTRQ